MEGLAIKKKIFFSLNSFFILLPFKMKQELQEVLKFPIEIFEFRSQFEIRTFIFLNTLDYGTLINKEME